MGLSDLFKSFISAGPDGTIGFDDLATAISTASVHVVDVREAHEYAGGHLPGAISLPLSSFDPAKLPTGKPVVLVCQAGARSAKALRQALAGGREDVVHFAPGTGGWRAKGGAVE